MFGSSVLRLLWVMDRRKLLKPQERPNTNFRCARDAHVGLFSSVCASSLCAQWPDDMGDDVSDSARDLVRRLLMWVGAGDRAVRADALAL